MSEKPTDAKLDDGKEKLMASSSRIDDFSRNQDGVSYALKFTDGEAPIPDDHGGETLHFTNRDHFEEWLLEQEAAIRPLLKAIQLGKAYRADPTLGAVFRANCVGKTTTVDLTAPTAVLSIG